MDKGREREIEREREGGKKRKKERERWRWREGKKNMRVTFSFRTTTKAPFPLLSPTNRPRLPTNRDKESYRSSQRNVNTVVKASLKAKENKIANDAVTLAIK